MNLSKQRQLLISLVSAYEQGLDDQLHELYEEMDPGDYADIFILALEWVSQLAQVLEDELELPRGAVLQGYALQGELKSEA